MTGAAPLSRAARPALSKGGQG